MKELARRTSSMGVQRIFWADNDGRLIENIVHTHDEWDPIFTANQDAAHEYRPHQRGSDIRRVASIPPDIFVKWLMEEGVDGFCDAEAIDMVVNKKLADPDNKYLLTVPTSYRMMRNG